MKASNLPGERFPYFVDGKAEPTQKAQGTAEAQAGPWRTKKERNPPHPSKNKPNSTRTLPGGRPSPLVFLATASPLSPLHTSRSAPLISPSPPILTPAASSLPPTPPAPLLSAWLAPLPSHTLGMRGGSAGLASSGAEQA